MTSLAPRKKLGDFEFLFLSGSTASGERLIKG